jgi:hypothetical protein
VKGQEPAVPMDSPHATWFFSEVQSQPRWSHHPTCSCYDHHLIRVGGYSLCQGCFCLAVGIFIALGVIAFHSHADIVPSVLLSPFWTILIGVVFYLPSLVQPFFQVRPFKVASRMCLGISVVVLSYEVLYLLPFNWTGAGLRLLSVFIFRYVYRLTQDFRHRHTPDPSAHCDKGCYPFCDGNRQRLDLLYDELTNRAALDDPFVPFARALIDSKDGTVEMGRSCADTYQTEL